MTAQPPRTYLPEAPSGVLTPYRKLPNVVALRREISVQEFILRLPDHGCGLFDCWPVATKRPDGYATFGARGGGLVDGEISAHRIVATIVWGPIPADYEVDHLCFVRNCVNPFHLRVCTLAENRRNRRPRPPKTHCPHGHVYADVGRTSQGRCKACQQSDMAAYHAAHRVEQNAKRAERRQKVSA